MHSVHVWLLSSAGASMLHNMRAEKVMVTPGIVIDWQSSFPVLSWPHWPSVRQQRPLATGPHARKKQLGLKGVTAQCGDSPQHALPQPEEWRPPLAVSAPSQLVLGGQGLAQPMPQPNSVLLAWPHRICGCTGINQHVRHRWAMKLLC